MKFIDCAAPATDKELSATESELGLQFPQSLKDLFRDANGGQPEPYCFKSDYTATWIVNGILTLERAAASYRLLVMDRGFWRPNLFPFAVDPGGALFLVDCETEAVMCWCNDYYEEGVRDGLTDFKCTLLDFWDHLVEEETVYPEDNAQPETPKSTLDFGLVEGWFEGRSRKK
ncbi:MAG: SMI1/KNR4 family protein [Pseudomonadota bacterium]